MRTFICYFAVFINFNLLIQFNPSSIAFTIIPSFVFIIKSNLLQNLLELLDLQTRALFIQFKEEPTSFLKNYFDLLAEETNFIILN